MLAAAYLLLILFMALFAGWLPLGFSPSATNLALKLQPPFQWHLYEPGSPFHWLGTDDAGRDVLAILVYGAQTALMVSIPAMVLAVIVGIGLGILAGYYGDTGLSWRTGKISSLVLSGLFFLFYTFGAEVEILFPQLGVSGAILQSGAIAFFSLLLYKILSFVFLRLPVFRKRIKLPLDLFVLKVIELIGSVPRLLLILCLAAFLPPSLAIVVWLSMLTFWPGIARLTRAETLKLKKLSFIEAAITLGFSPARVLLRHALPNMLVPILVAVTFGICNLIALETTLSFLGVGLPVNTPSWGRAINGFWLNPHAWWLLLFPGLNILLVVLALQNVNSYIIQLLHPDKSSPK